MKKIFLTALLLPAMAFAQTTGSASFTGVNIAYQTTYAPGVRAPLFIWQNPTNSNAAGTNAGQQIWIGNNPTATPAAGDTVGSTIAVINGNNRNELYGQNIAMLACGAAEGCTTSDYVDSRVVGQEIDVGTSASYTAQNSIFSPSSGTNPVVGLETYCDSNSHCTTADAIWSNDTTGNKWFANGIEIARVGSVGIHFENISGDSVSPFQSAAIQDDSSSKNVIDVGPGTHTNYFNAPNLQIAANGNILTGGRTEALGVNNYAVFGGASGTSAMELQTGSATGLYCATDGATYGECMTGSSAEELLLGSANVPQLTLKTTGVTVSAPLTPSAGIVSVGGSAASGQVGYYTANSSAGTSMTNGVGANCTSLALPAGDWDIRGTVQFVPAGTTTVTTVIASISQTSATSGGLTGGETVIQAALTTGAQQYVSTRTARVLLTSAGTVYLVGAAGFGTSTMTCNGYIEARLTH